MYIGNIKFLIIAGLLLSGAITGFIIFCESSQSPYQKMMRKKSFDKRGK